MKHILNRLVNHETISTIEAKQVLIKISKGDYNQSQIASFLTVFMMRNITLEELKGFRDALLELCIPVDLSAYNPIDLCGTGGDGKDTFNISTLSSFVTAAAGVPVATVTLNGAKNAGILAAEIISTFDNATAEKLEKYKSDLKIKVQDMQV